MNSTDILRYVDAIFGYCLKRLNNPEDARDLSQDILCELLAHVDRQPIEHPNAWVWTIAHRQYCRFLRRRKKPCCSLDDGALNGTLSAPEPEDNAAQRDAVFRALHTLAASHREVMVDFYVLGLKCEQIAQKRGLHPDTVRSRLFFGREKLRQRWIVKMEETKIYERSEWFITGNGDVNTALIRRQISRSILTACYEQYQTIDQLSIATGIPALYIEDELEALLGAGALERRGDRCRAQMILRGEASAAEAEARLLHHAGLVAPLLREELDLLWPKVRAIGFHGCDLPKERLSFSLIPILLREAITLARSAYPDLVRGSFPLRPDGSRGWLCAFVSQDGSRRYFSGCNAYYRDHSCLRYYWSQDLRSEDLIRMLWKLEEAAPPSAEVSISDDSLLAECIRCDLIVRKGDGVQWNIPVLTAEEARRLLSAMQESIERLAGALRPAVGELYQLWQRDVPRHLHDQIRGVFGVEFNAIIDMLCRMLLPQPEVSPFAGQVVLFTGDSSALVF